MLNETIESEQTIEFDAPVDDSTDQGYIEDYSIAVKVTFLCIAVVSITSSTTAFIVMFRAKKIPYASKFMTSGLLTFDMLFLLTSTLRKFVTHGDINLNIQAVVVFNLELAVFTVGLVSLERYFLIIRPMVYMHYAKKKLIRLITLSLWAINISLCFFVRYGVCYIRYQSLAVFTHHGLCTSTVTMYYAVVLIAVLTTSFVCYWKIYKCVRSKTSPGNVLSVSATFARIKSYRSTSLVFVYLAVVLVSSLGYGIIIISTNLGLKHTKLRVATEIVSIFNCVVDPFLYVLWFKECRLQLLLFVSFFFKRYKQTAEEMRIEVYDIVTASSAVKREKNCVP